MAGKMNGHKSILGRMLKHRRLMEELTRDELSEKTGLSVSLIARIERDECYPDAPVLRKLAKALHINENELLIYNNRIPEQRFAGKKGRNGHCLDDACMPRSALTQRLMKMHQYKQRNGFRRR